MKTPDVSCEIDAYCSINPSEDPKKVEQAITNVLVNVDVEINKETLRATSSSLESLEKIYEAIHSHQTKNAYRRQLNQNLRDDSSWFYLNKQAAFVNTIALCSESEESPLGPIKIVLNSKNIDTIIEWLVFN
jgi:predicted RNA binding protein with dsRBD fold (UPF0201 family)